MVRNVIGQHAGFPEIKAMPIKGKRLAMILAKSSPSLGSVIA